VTKGGHSIYRCGNYSREETQGRKLFKGGNYLRKYGSFPTKGVGSLKIFLYRIEPVSWVLSSRSVTGLMV
jgi:hypothetical protein